MNARILILGLCLITTAACSQKGSGGGGDAPSVSTYVVKGDPHEVLAGAQFKPESPFTAANIADLNDFSLTAIASFVEREKTVAGDVDLEDENAANSGDAPQTYRLSVTAQSDSTYLVDVSGVHLQILFAEEAGGKLQIKSLQSGAETVSVNVLHWSQTPDGNVMSFLLDFNDSAAGQTIAGFYIRREASAQALPQYDHRFYYLGGPGVGITWDPQEILKFEVCGDSSQYAPTVSAMNPWKSLLQNRLDIQVVQASQYGPFTELNQHCLYVVNTYISDPRNDVANFGLTIPVMNRNTGRIVDSDVMIFKAEFEKLHEPVLSAGGTEAQYQYAVQYYKNISFIHELGHVLGLDHQFDGTLSIMSYDFNVTNVTSYDVQAIQTLYPVRTSGTP